MRAGRAVSSSIVSVCVFLSAVGCAGAPARPTSQAPFVCEGAAERPAQQLKRVSEGPIGRIEVRSLDPVPKDPVVRAKLEDWLPWRLRITAERVSVGRLASALSEVLGLDVAVDASIMDSRVYLALPDATFEKVLRILAEQYEVVAEFRQGVLFIDGAEKKHPAAVEPQLESLTIDVGASASPEQLAATWCKTAASSRGTASVIGNSVLFRDVPASLSRAGELAHAPVKLAPAAVAPVAASGN